jgi:hypothetical protein
MQIACGKCARNQKATALFRLYAETMKGNRTKGSGLTVIGRLR